MKTTYKGFNIEECDGLNYVPKAPKIQFYDPDDCDGRMFFANSIDEAKEIIDDMQNSGFIEDLEVTGNIHEKSK